MTAQKLLINFPPENLYRSDVVYRRGGANLAGKRLGLQSVVMTKHNSCTWHVKLKLVKRVTIKTKQMANLPNRYSALC